MLRRTRSMIQKSKGIMPCSTSLSSSWRSRGETFRARRRSLRRDPADAVGRPEADSRKIRRAAGQSRLAFSGLHAGRRNACSIGRAASSATPAPCARKSRAPARPVRPAAHRRDPDHAGDGGVTHNALSRDGTRTLQFTILSRTSIEILALLENLEIDAGLTYLDNEPLGRVGTRAALSRTLSAAHLGRRAARQPRQRDLGGGRAKCRSAC